MFSDPEQNIEQFRIQEGMYVADLGAGSGFYTLAIAKVVGALGKVYAVDVLKDMLLKIKNDARDKHFSNVEIIWGDIEKIGGTKLRDGAVDRAVLANILFQLEDKSRTAGEIKRILKPRGKLLVVDWSESFRGMGPNVESVVSKETAKAIFEKEGFVLEKEISAGEHHYGLIFRKPSAS